MQQNSPPPPPPPPIPSPVYLEMASAAPHFPSGDPTTSSSLFDWSDFLDFDIDGTLNIPSPQIEPVPRPEHGSETGPSQPSEDSGRVRKRDPRLVCPNFLAGVVPCACPELDEQFKEEEEEALPGKKRARSARVSGESPARCQVPGCEADIIKLKGYHKRHRVCLQCANASAVVFGGESKRYCQQCGKFHLLSDFDEGKRSCRRKLERHNNRRRRKPSESKGGDNDKDPQQITSADDVSGDDNPQKDGKLCSSNQIEEREVFLESDRNISTPFLAQGSQNLQRDGFTSSADGIRIDEPKQNPNYKNTFSSMCPAGRISFKLYDWNPAEFPRRLRHQIFQWLASMPIELEGYIRPGCTILTAFIAMPKPTWLKLLEEPALRIKDLVASPGNMLSGKGDMLVYLNDMIFRVTNDANSVVKVRLKNRSPKLHYIYPTCFEAGMPMEFIACGSDLLQPKFRFLVSFAGRYLKYNISISSPPPCCAKGDSNSVDHQVLKISIPKTDMNLFGPAFIEVENQSGLSNFVPVLIGDKETCAEMDILQRKLDTSQRQVSPSRSSCEDFALRRAQLSDFILDVAYSLKRPVPEQQLTSSHIQRFDYLFKFLIEKESSVILKRLYCSLKSATENNLVANISDADMRSLRNNTRIAQSLLHQKLQLQDKRSSGFLATNTGMGIELSPSPNGGPSPTHPLLNDEVVMNVNIHTRPRTSCARFLSRSFLTSPPLLMAIAIVAVCFGACAVVFHPQRVSQIATTIRRCLFDTS
ncbi:hypothetical protein ACP275_07G022000 [Erythranthe tilingii]